MPSSDRFADVGIPVPLGQSFSYRIPSTLVDRVRPGIRVLCPFGNRKVLGVVLEVGDDPPPIEPSKIRDLAAVLDPEPVLPEELLAFVRQLAPYYFAPIGEVLRLAVPAVERGAGPQALVTRFARERVEDLETTLAAAPQRRSAIDAELERLALDFQIASRLTSWVAVSDEIDVDPRAPGRREEMPHELPHGMSLVGLGLRAPRAQAWATRART